MATLKVNDKSFDTEVIKSSKPVLVDFWAEWCGPCKQIGPILEEISKEREEDIIVAKLNVDENTDTAQKYGIRGIPTMMIFNKGKLIDTKVGSIPKNTIIEWIESIIN